MINNFKKLSDIINDAKNKFPNLDLKKENNTKKLMEFLKDHDENLFNELKMVVEKIDKTSSNTDLSLKDKFNSKIDIGKTTWDEEKIRK